MVTIEELTKYKKILDDWKSRELTKEEQGYIDDFRFIFTQAIQCDFDPDYQSEIASLLYGSLDTCYNHYYIVVNEDEDEVKYLNFYAEPTNDINKAAICISESTAFFLIDDYKEDKYWNNEISKEEWDDHSCNLGFKIVPVKRVVSYERI